MSEQREPFYITNEDKRQEIIDHVEAGIKYETQTPYGKDIKVFKPNIGFLLLRKLFKINPDETLQVVQKLYEQKLVTYPRTDD